MKDPVFLFLFANSQKEEILELSEELRDIKKHFLIHPRYNDLKFEEDAFVTFDSIAESLRGFKNRVVVFHYAGHAGQGKLLLRDGGKSLSVIGELLAQQENLQLVFLNGCSTDDEVDALLAMDIPNVIATSRPINDQYARILAEQFYASLTEDYSLGLSFDAAKTYLKGKDWGGEIKRYRSVVNRAEHELSTSAWGLYNIEERAEHWRISASLDDYLIGLSSISERIDFPTRPYKGLDYFRSEDARIFFGRSIKILELTEAISKKEQPLILLYGHSGVGKSSLINAGLLPRITDDWDIIAVRDNHEAECHRLVDQEWTRKTIIIFDQLEELLTDSIVKSDSAAGFFYDLQVIVERQHQQPLKIILGFRKEYLAEFNQYVGRFQLRGQVTPISVEPLSQQNIIEVINGLTSTKELRDRYNLSLDDGLADQIALYLAADRKSNIAPALQILLTRMWDLDTGDPFRKKFTFQIFSDLKDKGVLLEEYVDKQLIKLGKYGWGKSGLAIDILVSFCSDTISAKTLHVEEINNKYAHINRTEGQEVIRINDILLELKNRFLLTEPFVYEEDKPKKPSLRLAHDSLAPIVMKIFNQSDLLGQQALRLWNNASAIARTDVSNLFNQAQIDILQKGKYGMRIWSVEEEQLFEASESRIRSRKRRRNRLIGALVFFVAVALVALLRQYQLTQEKNNTEIAGLLEDGADQLVDPNSKHTMLLASLQRSYDANTEKKFYRNYHENHLYDSIYHFSDMGNLAAISPDGHFIAMTRMKGIRTEVDMYTYANGRVSPLNTTITDIDNDLNTLSFMKTGDKVFGGGTDRYIHIWNIAGVKKSRYRFKKSIQYMSDSPDGRYLIISLIGDRWLYVYDVDRDELVDSTLLKYPSDYMDFYGPSKVYAYTDSATYFFDWDRSKLLKTGEDSIVSTTNEDENEESKHDISFFKAGRNEGLVRVALDQNNTTLFTQFSDPPKWLDAAYRSDGKEVLLITTEGELQRYGLPYIGYKYQLSDGFGSINANLVISESMPASLITVDYGGVHVGIPGDNYDYEMKPIWQGAKAPISCADQSGGTIVLGDTRGNVYKVDILNDSLVGEWEIGNEPISQIAISESSNYALIYGQDGKLVSLDLDKDTVQTEQLIPYTITDIYSYDNLDQFYVLCSDGLVRMINSIDLRVVDSIKAPRISQEGFIEVSEGNNGLVIGIDKNLYHCNENGEVISINNLEHAITSLDITSNGQEWIGAVGLENGTCLIFDKKGNLYHRIVSALDNWLLIELNENWIVLIEDYTGETEIWQVPPPPQFDYKIK